MVSTWNWHGYLSSKQCMVYPITYMCGFLLLYVESYQDHQRVLDLFDPFSSIRIHKVGETDFHQSTVKPYKARQLVSVNFTTVAHSSVLSVNCGDSLTCKCCCSMISNGYWFLRNTVYMIEYYTSCISPRFVFWWLWRSWCYNVTFSEADSFGINCDCNHFSLDT